MAGQPLIALWFPSTATQRASEFELGLLGVSRRISFTFALPHHALNLFRFSTIVITVWDVSLPCCAGRGTKQTCSPHSNRLLVTNGTQWKCNEVARAIRGTSTL